MISFKRLLILLIIYVLPFSNIYAEAPQKVNMSGEIVVVKEVLKYCYIQNFNKKNSRLKLNDIIIKIEDKKTKIPYPKEFIYKPHLLGEDMLIATVLRDNNTIKIELTKDDLAKANITNVFSYIGTITALQGKYNFVGISHPIILGKNILTNDLIQETSIYKVDQVEVRKRRFVGVSELYPKMDRFEVIGKVDAHTGYGIKGELFNNNKKFIEVETATPKVGEAYIYYKPPKATFYKKFKIYITHVEEDISYIKIIDRELLKHNGGLIKGMSGSPVLQEGKLVGGVRSSINKNKNLGRISNIDAMFN